MTATREQVMQALLMRLSGAAPFGLVTRRNLSPETIAAPGKPAIALLKLSEHYDQSPRQPRRLTMTAVALVYIDVGEDVNAIPDAALNVIQDAIDAALAPDDPVRGTCTLGGLVYSAMAHGLVQCAPGEKTGKGLAVIPIEIVLP